MRDSAAAYAAVSGYETGAPYAGPSLPADLVERIAKPIGRKLRIARWSTGFAAIDIAPECIAALDHATDALRALGHEVVEAPLLDIDYLNFLERIIDVLAVSAHGAVQARLGDRDPDLLPQLLEPAIYDAWLQGGKIEAARYVEAISTFHRIGRAFGDFFESYDFVLTPTLTTTPKKLGELSTNDEFRTFRRKAGAYTAFLAIANASGIPGANLPLYQTAHGLPIGVQVMGPYGADAELMQLAANVEVIAPWAHRRPF